MAHELVLGVVVIVETRVPRAAHAGDHIPLDFLMRADIRERVNHLYSPIWFAAQALLPILCPEENDMVVKPPVIRSFTLPNGDKIVSLRESTLRAGLKAANTALKAERQVGRTRPSIAKPRA